MQRYGTCGAKKQSWTWQRSMVPLPPAQRPPIARRRELLPEPLGPEMISDCPSRNSNERPVIRVFWPRGVRSTMPDSRRQTSSNSGARLPFPLPLADPSSVGLPGGSKAAAAGGCSCNSIAVGCAGFLMLMPTSRSSAQAPSSAGLPSKSPSCSCLTRTACAPKLEMSSSWAAISVMEAMSCMKSIDAWPIAPKVTWPSKYSGASTRIGRKCKQTAKEAWNPWKTVDTKSRR
mmetsp:Transcript_76969/g.204301  ORF Transcript_76969/g.204301 Transcript_76969/m.204301 type:complete len:232 (-) Transcript_76969:114-809(-)